MPDKCVLVFVKYPDPGKVKTRLAKSIGDKNAAVLYKRLAEKAVLEADKTGYDVVIAVSDKNDLQRFKGWFGRRRSYICQEGKSLGRRMKNAFNTAFKSGYAQAVLTGTDCFELDELILKAAFKKLERTDIVIGPAVDGGYYLIGFRRTGFYDKIFSNIEWSTGRVLKQTMGKLKKTGKTAALLKKLRDIDTLEDLETVKVKWRNNDYLRFDQKIRGQ